MDEMQKLLKILHESIERRYRKLFTLNDYHENNEKIIIIYNENGDEFSIEIYFDNNYLLVDFFPSKKFELVKIELADPKNDDIRAEVFKAIEDNTINIIVNAHSEYEEKLNNLTVDLETLKELKKTVYKDLTPEEVLEDKKERIAKLRKSLVAIEKEIEET